MTPSPAERFERLTGLLAEWYPIWSVEPFQCLQPPWASFRPQFTGDFRSDAAALASWLPIEQLAELIDLPRMPAIAAPPPERWGYRVSGRKWRQIVAFTARVHIAPGQSVVEWCAGKGHLARTLARSHCIPVSGLECDARLCREGQALAEHQGVSLHLHQQDVLEPDVPRWLHPATHVVALHACGDLHLRLLDLAAQTGCAISLAPCCYQRTVHERYQPLSETGRELAGRHALVLTRQDLALAVQETVTAPSHAQRQRRRAKAWRLGFDLLQRELRGVDEYLPVPRLRYGDLPADYQGFCRWAAAVKQLALPSSTNWKARERAGWIRLEEVERLEQVRHVFRRPLEVWLTLDRARRLEEAGLRVDLGLFCPREVTPRNLLLRAARE
ncbi:MAG: SAM-dependent methyltransferase [Thioalkalivibrio sp.]|nr:SAM-dependent methyltransferase [Thioalkalivibrio sp.]